MSGLAYHEPDLSDVLATTDAIAPHLRPGQIVSPRKQDWHLNVDHRAM